MINRCKLFYIQERPFWNWLVHFLAANANLLVKEAILSLLFLIRQSWEPVNVPSGHVIKYNGAEIQLLSFQFLFFFSYMNWKLQAATASTVPIYLVMSFWIYAISLSLLHSLPSAFHHLPVDPVPEDDHGYAINDRPARGRRPVFEAYWNGRLIPYTLIEEWVTLPMQAI